MCDRGGNGFAAAGKSSCGCDTLQIDSGLRTTRITVADYGITVTVHLNYGDSNYGNYGDR